MNKEGPGEEHITDEDFHGEFDENLFQDLVADDILDPDLNINNPNMESGRQCAGNMNVTNTGQGDYIFIEVRILE